MKNDFWETLGFSALSLVFWVFALSVLLLFLGIKISALNFLLANIISFMTLGFVLKGFKKTFVAHIVNFIIIFILAHYFANTMDFTADVLLYHLQAIKLLAEGWNPIDPNAAYAVSHDWIKYFPKANWIINAAFTKFFSNLEASKLLGVFLIYISIIFTYCTMKSYSIAKKVVNIVLALLIGLNTVSLVQSHTFLVDGVLSSLLIVIISTLALFVKEKKYCFLYACCLASALAINVKLSAVVYVIIILIGAVYFVKTSKIKYVLSIVSTVLISLFLLGFNPYGINSIKHHNPFYPIGSTDVDIVKDSCPAAIEHKFYLTKFAISIFSEAGNIYEAPKLKMPFTITKKDKQLGHHPQLYMEGFGYMFSGVVILTLLAVAVLFKKRNYKKFIYASGILLLSVFINPECWWARFVPQFYLLPFFAIFFALLKNKDGKKNDRDDHQDTLKYNITAYILISAIALNTIFTGFFHLKKVFEHQNAQRELTYGLRHFNGSIYVSKNDPRIEGIRILFNNARINYIEVDELNCPANQILKYSTVKLCLIKNTEQRMINEK